MSDVFEKTRDRVNVNTVLHLRERIAREEAKRGPQLSIIDRATLERAIEKVTPVYAALSLPVPEPKANEDAFYYRRRVVEDLKRHHPQWAKSNPGRIPDPEGFRVIEGEVLSAARARGLNPEYRGHVPPGTLRERQITDAAGNVSTVFHGSPADAWAPFCGPMKTAVLEIRSGPGGRRLYPRD